MSPIHKWTEWPVQRPRGTEFVGQREGLGHRGRRIERGMRKEDSGVWRSWSCGQLGFYSNVVGVNSTENSQKRSDMI